MVNNPPAMQEIRVQALSWEDPLEKGPANHSSILAWRIHGQRNRAGYNPWGHKESETTELPRNGLSRNPPNQTVSQTFRLSDSTLYASLRAWSHLPGNFLHCPLPSAGHLHGPHFPNSSLHPFSPGPRPSASTPSPCCPPPIPSSTGQGDRSSGSRAWTMPLSCSTTICNSLLPMPPALAG